MARGPMHPSSRANRGEPSFHTIAYKSSSTVYMRNCKPGSWGRVTLGLGSLGWRDRVTMRGEPTFSYENGFKRVSSPNHAEHAHVDISVRLEGQHIKTGPCFFPCRRAVKLAGGEGGWGASEPRANFLNYLNRALVI